MTANTTKTRELNIDTIVRRAYQLAGLVPAEQGLLDNARSALGRDLLEMLVDELQSSSGPSRQRQWEVVAVVAGTATYTMASDVLSVVNDGSFLPTGDTTGATPVSPMSMAEYTTLSNKTAEGRPTTYFIHRTSPQVLYLWPVPSEAGSLTLQVDRLLGDNDDGTKTLDLERHWVSWATYALSARLAQASSLPASVVSALNKLADRARDEAQAYSSDQEPYQIHVGHMTPWSR